MELVSRVYRFMFSYSLWKLSFDTFNVFVFVVFSFISIIYLRGLWVVTTTIKQTKRAWKWFGKCHVFHTRVWTFLKQNTDKFCKHACVWLIDKLIKSGDGKSVGHLTFIFSMAFLFKLSLARPHALIEITILCKNTSPLATTTTTTFKNRKINLFNRTKQKN